MDQVDRRILALLQEDARMGYQEIGDAVGLSGPAVFQRVRKLEDGGVVTGYHAAIHPDAVGRGTTAFVRVIPGPATDVERLKDVWRGASEVQSCHLMSGRVGYLLRLSLARPSDVESILESARRSGCDVHAELALTTIVDRRRVPVFQTPE